jgi:hypothetical protein
MYTSPDNTDPATSAEPSADRVDDLEQLRERLAFYESFDQLINDNITRAGDLLREAAARKSEGELALRQTTAEFEQRQLAERGNYRRIFSSLLDEITAVQQNVERLARQVSDALDDLEAVIPAAGEPSEIDGDQFPSMPTFSAGAAGALDSGEDVSVFDPSHAQADSYGRAEIAAEPVVPAQAQATSPGAFAESPEPAEPAASLEPVDELVTSDEAHFETTAASETGSLTSSVGGGVSFPNVVQASVERVSQTMGGPEFAVEPQPEAAAAPEQEITEAAAEQSIEPLPDDGISVDLEEEPVDAAASMEADQAVNETEEAIDDWVDTGDLAATTLLVHGVPRGTTALSLKRYLEGLAQVHSVEPREYAEGILRLQVSSDHPVRLEDLQGWPEAESLEPVSVSDEFVEVRLTR